MSCLFDSLSTYVHTSPHNLRNMICHYLETNPLLMDDMTAETVIKAECDSDFKKYIASMYNSSTMGGAIEIKAFVNMFRINITVVSLPNNKLIEFTSPGNEVVKKIRWTGGHFDPL